MLSSVMLGLFGFPRRTPVNMAQHGYGGGIPVRPRQKSRLGNFGSLISDLVVTAYSCFSFLCLGCRWKEGRRRNRGRPPRFNDDT